MYSAHRNIPYRNQPTGPPRRGALIVCVLVLLMIIGLMMSQTMQTLMLVRRGEAVRQQLRQARELLELGELVLLQQPAGELPNAPLLVSLVDPDSETSSSTAGRASIAFTPVESGDTSHSSVRIAVTYPVGSSRELTSTHTVVRRESIDNENQP